MRMRITFDIAINHGHHKINTMLLCTLFIIVWLYKHQHQKILLKYLVVLLDMHFLKSIQQYGNIIIINKIITLWK